MAWQKMTRHARLAVLALWWVGNCPANTPDAAPDTGAAYKIGHVVQVTVSAHAVPVADGPGQDDACQPMLTPRLASFFLTHAHSVAGLKKENIALSACGAVGQVTLSNGEAGEWTIQPGGMGLLQLTKGARQGQVMVLYCEPCARWRFVLTHDPDHLRYKLTQARAISVTKASWRTDYDPAEDCSAFVINPKRAAFFFRHAKPVTKHDRMHLLDFSSCKADGTVRFANGDQADWTIERGGVAVLQMRNGRLRGEQITLHCKACEAWGF